jgi:hypothetical protein
MPRVLAVCLLVVLASSLFAATPPQYLDQNWSEAQRQWFYTTPQGSKLVQYAWALALERPASEELFFADDGARFAFLPNVKSAKWNPDGLPVGFVKDTGSPNYLGLTCAACHTGEVDYKGVTYRIDGAPTDADLFAFLAELSEALSATTVSAADLKFLRFAKRVLGANSSSADERKKLFNEVSTFSRQFARLTTDSVPDTSWGRARTDAFGMIFNRVTSIDLHLPANSRKPNAPVSYPFLWDTSWHDKVQWNGSAANQFAVLRLARNVGEVLGVFAQLEIKRPLPLLTVYSSSAKKKNLLAVEDQLSALRSPHWPTQFPPIDATKAGRGKQVYSDAGCLDCHKIATPGIPQNIVMTPLPSIGTDSAMTYAAATRRADSGILTGVPALVLVGDRLPAKGVLAAQLAFNGIIGAILSPFDGGSGGAPRPPAVSARNDEGELADIVKPAKGPSLITKIKTTLTDLKNQQSQLAQEYKARPLDGIWATAPYLHNGSVPTLRDLFTPPSARPKMFSVGSRELDPVSVGFDTSPGPDRFLFDTTKPGNGNAGHEWGINLKPDDRDALIEYLKSL